jgi:hypothetical protein
MASLEKRQDGLGSLSLTPVRHLGPRLRFSEERRRRWRSPGSVETSRHHRRRGSAKDYSSCGSRESNLCSVDLAMRLAVISEDHGVFKGAKVDRRLRRLRRKCAIGMTQVDMVTMRFDQGMGRLDSRDLILRTGFVVASARQLRGRCRG